MIDVDDVLSTVSETSGRLTRNLASAPAFLHCGKVIGINGAVIEVGGLKLPVGHACHLHLSDGRITEAEVIGFNESTITIMPFENITGVRYDTLVSPKVRGHTAKVGNALLGRIVNALGEPIDGLGDIVTDEYYPYFSDPINPLHRRRIDKVIDVGVRAMNGLMTIGEGQRMGIFAEAGLGKSVLLGMMTKFSSAEVIVVGLIGERGREVKEFIEEILGEAGLKKTVVIAAPADQSPLMKVTAAHYATTAAEYFRNQGKAVLLIIDSITRYAQSYRQMSLSNGEMPTAKGYTPSVFAKLSSLIERSGNGCDQSGSITAFYTVLTEGEDLTDPIAEHVRSLIDGHIILSRELAEEGHFPAIDVERSLSRLMMNLVDIKHAKLALLFKRLVSAYNKNKDMINIGMYHSGSDPYVDAAITHRESIRNYLTQSMSESATLDASLAQLEYLIKQVGFNI